MFLCLIAQTATDEMNILNKDKPSYLPVSRFNAENYDQKHTNNLCNQSPKTDVISVLKSSHTDSPLSPANAIGIAEAKASPGPTFPLTPCTCNTFRPSTATDYALIYK